MTTPNPAKPDLAEFAAAVRFRDRAVAAAKAHHERVGLAPSTVYARATFDAISELIRENERERLARAGRLAPPDADTRPAGRCAAPVGAHQHSESCGVPVPTTPDSR